MGRTGTLCDVLANDDPGGHTLSPGASAYGHVIDRLVAHGGCGSVYLARHRTTGRPVAVKVLHPNLAPLPKMIERFVREVELLRRIRHPNIVEIYDVGALPDGTPFFVMEYLSGVTLDTLLATRGRLGPDEALELLEPVCAALSAAHGAGIVHRDVKASNVMVCEGPAHEVKLLDFGIAKLIDSGPGTAGLTTVGRQIGTPTIMAPEQLLCAPVDARADVYALGALLFRMLTGRLPFESPWPGDLVRMHLEEPAPRPSERVPLSREMDAVVLKCLEKRPERRFDSPQSLVRALRKAVGGNGALSSAAELPRLAVGLFLEIRVRDDGGDDDGDGLAMEIERVLASAEARLTAGGFVVATATSAEVLGIRLLARDPALWQNERQACLDFALAFHEAMQRRPCADPRVHVNVAVHAGEVAVREREGGAPEIVGGPLSRTGDWTPAEEVPDLSATWEMVHDLESFAAAPGPDPLLLVTRPET